MSFVPNSANFRGQFGLAQAVDSVFPLFSPLGEKHWVPNWDPELLYPSGVSWVEGLIFRTEEEAGPAIWLVTSLDMTAHRVSYFRVEPRRYVARVTIACSATTTGHTEVTSLYSYVGLSEQGNRDIAAMTEEQYAAKMIRWGASISQYFSLHKPDIADDNIGTPV